MVYLSNRRVFTQPSHFFHEFMLWASFSISPVLHRRTSIQIRGRFGSAISYPVRVGPKIPFFFRISGISLAISWLKIRHEKKVKKSKKKSKFIFLIFSSFCYAVKKKPKRFWLAEEEKSIASTNERPVFNLQQT